MSDNHSEAFEACWRTAAAQAGGNLGHDNYEAFKGGWQAASARYAPHVTEIVAVDFAANSIAIADCGKWDSLPEGDEKAVYRRVTCKLYYRYLAKAALRAAGVKFRDEA